MGGVGKSELARKVAAEMTGHFTDGQILVDMLGTTAQARTATDAMTDVLKALGQKDVQPATLKADYQSALRGKHLLVLLDNVANAQGLADLVPPPPAALVVTSRSRLALPGVQPIALGHLSRDAAKALLGAIVPALDDATLDSLAKLCCDLPLALRVAGSYLAETGYPADAYLAELGEKRRLTHLAASAGDIERADLDPMVVLGHSYDRLAEADPALAQAFTLLAVFPADFDIAGAAAVLDVEEPETRRRLGLLHRRALLQQPAQGRWRLHDLLRELASARADKPALDEATGRHSRHYLHLLDWCANEHTNNRQHVRQALGLFESNLANFAPAIAFTAGRNDLPKVATGHLGAGLLFAALGRPEDALAVTEKAVALYRRLVEARPDAFLPDLGLSLNNLGMHFNALGRREEALAATDEAVAIRRRLAEAKPDAFFPDLAMSLNNLGMHLSAIGRAVEALAATEEAVALYRRLAKAKPDAFLPDLAMSLNNLGAMLSGLGRREDALSASEESVAHYRRLAEARPDAFFPELAASVDNLGNNLSDLGRREDALAASEEAAAIRRRLAQARPDAFLPDLARSLNNLGNNLSGLGRAVDALAAIEEAIAIRRRLAEAKPDAFLLDLAVSLAVRANCLEALERLPEALASNAEAIAALRPTFLAHPPAVRHWMAAMHQQYVERCQKLGVEPDSALIGPITDILQRLEAEPDEG